MPPLADPLADNAVHVMTGWVEVGMGFHYVPAPFEEIPRELPTEKVGLKYKPAFLGGPGCYCAPWSPAPPRRATLANGNCQEKPMDESKIDRAAMGKIAKALAFIIGADNPATVAMRVAAASGIDRDIKAARALFLKLKAGDRRAALDMIQD